MGQSVSREAASADDSTQKRREHIKSVIILYDLKDTYSLDKSRFFIMQNQRTLALKGEMCQCGYRYKNTVQSCHLAMLMTAKIFIHKFSASLKTTPLRRLEALHM
jgi:hypothetical protein